MWCATGCFASSLIEWEFEMMIRFVLIVFVSAPTLLWEIPAARGEDEGHEFIAKVGTYKQYDGALTIEVFTQAENLNFHITMKDEGAEAAIEPSVPSIFRDTEWFVYAESRHDVWIYDGKTTVYRILRSPRKMLAASSEVDPSLFEKAPEPVRDRLPKSLKARNSRGEM